MSIVTITNLNEISFQDVAVFAWKYSFYDCEYVANDNWQSLPMNFRWLPTIFRNPIPYSTALLARASDIAISVVFATFAFTASLLFEELAARADDLTEGKDIKEDSENISLDLEQWRRQYYLVCRLVDKINSCFGCILLLQIAIGFALPIFDFFKILYTKGLVSRFYFEFIHTIFRFLIFMLIPSYFVDKKVH